MVTDNGRVMSSAIGIDPADVLRVTEILLATNEVQAFTGIFSYRWVKGTKATLGFTKFNHTCIVELDGELSNRALDFCRTFWRALDAAGIRYTFHWGKVLELDATSIRTMYGSERVSAWLSARKTLMQDPSSMRVFTNDFMVGLGLDTIVADGGVIA